EFSSGRAPEGPRDVAIGSEVAERLGYTLGAEVVLAHGLGEVSFAEHEVHPFRVVGIIARTATPIDRAVYVTLEGLEEMHAAEIERNGLVPPHGVAGHDEPPITSFLVGTKNRFETLRLQREMNEDRAEPL